MPSFFSEASVTRMTCSTRSRVISASASRTLTCKVACTMRLSSKQIIRNTSSTGVPVSRATKDG